MKWILWLSFENAHEWKPHHWNPQELRTWLSLHILSQKDNFFSIHTFRRFHFLFSRLNRERCFAELAIACLFISVRFSKRCEWSSLPELVSHQPTPPNFQMPMGWNSCHVMIFVSSIPSFHTKLDRPLSADNFTSFLCLAWATYEKSRKGWWINHT